MNERYHKPAAFTLVEMLMAMGVMSLVAIGLAFLSTAVQESSEHTLGQGNAAQHARVALERIEARCRGAYANESFPGFAVFADTVGIYTFPEVLVVWSPASTPANPTGLPQFNELLFYFPNPSSPNELLEVTVPDDSRTAPAITQTASWLSEIVAIQKSETAEQVVLTDLVHIGGNVNGSRRGAVRFQTIHWPTTQDMALYRAGLKTWDSMKFAQGVIDDERGLAHHACQIELQLTPDDRIGEIESQRDPVPFFGSEAIYYMIER